MTEDIPQKYSDPGSDASDGSDAPPGRENPGARAGRLYAIDSGSPLSSVTLLWNGEASTREFKVGDSSGRLITDLNDLLAEAGGELGDLDGLVALAGPGSFTGLRVGLATLLGLHQATGIPATAATTFEALAWQARRCGQPSGQPILAAVDALRGERFTQSFDGATLASLSEPELLSAEAVAARAGTRVIGFGLESLRGSGDRPKPEADFLDAEALAPDLAAIASQPGFTFDPGTLTRPLYLRPAAVTPAKSR